MSHNPPALSPAHALAQAASLITPGVTLCVLSGAGLSKASGIPTYRDLGGLWANEETARFSHADGLRDNPAEFVKFWKARRSELLKAKPNAGHLALVDLMALRPGSHLVTQNVDGLLQKAGAPEVLELHGSLSRLRCDQCGRRSGLWLGMRCLRCLSPARPDVVMFGENLDESVFYAARDAATKCGVFLVVGTTAQVYPAALLPELAVKWGAKLVVIDTEPTPLAMCAHVFIQDVSEQALPALIKHLK